MPSVNDFIHTALQNAPGTFTEKATGLAFLETPGQDEAKLQAAHALLAEVAAISDCSMAWEGLVRDRLTAIEQAFRPLITTHRDHVIHSAHLYLLGLALYLEMIRREPALCAVLAENYFRDVQALYSDSSSSYYCHYRLTRANASLPETRTDFPATYDLAEPQYKRFEYLSDLEESLQNRLPINLRDLDAIFRRCWGQSAILHDLAYSLELSIKLLKEYLDATVAKKGCTVCCSENLFALDITRFCDVVTVPLVQTVCGKPMSCDMYTDNSITMIATNIRHKLHLEYSGDTLSRLIRETFQTKISQGICDHGVFSAFLMLKWINSALRDRIQAMPGIRGNLASGTPVIDKPDRRVTENHPASAVEFFYIECVDAATAVYLHNSKTYVPAFKDRELDYRDHPFAWLLFLCDQLQEWCRPSNAPPAQPPDMNGFRIDIVDVGKEGGPRLYFEFPDKTEEIRKTLKAHLRLFGADFVRGAI